MNTTKSSGYFVVLAEGEFASVRHECGSLSTAAALCRSLERFGFLCSIVVKVRA